MANDSPRHVQLRQDLQQSRQQHQGKSYLVVKDPIARRYFRFTEQQAVILELLAEPTDAETVAALASEKLGGRLSAATIAAFFDSLESKNLIDTPEVRERLGTSGSPNKRKESSILYKQVASFDPERIFNWLLPRTRWAFTPAFQVFGCLLIACGVTIFLLNWQDLKASTPDLLNVWTILMVWPIVFSVSAYHEFSHGLTCRHFGGQVKEVGFMLIYFSPAFYCDVSDAWMFPKRGHRMAVTLAGGYSQLMLWSICAILWRLTEPDTLINQVMIVVVLFSGLQTLFNFNPLIKLDGYYMLSDYLEVPNLRAKAFSTLWNWITRNAKRRTLREDRAQLLYGASAVVFSTTLLVAVYSAIYTWSTQNWATAGLVGFAVFSTITLRRTAVESIVGLKTFVSHVATRKIRNSLIVLTALLISIFGHMELKIPASFKILPQGELTVRVETSGTVTEVFAREGVRVRKDELLARMRDFGKENEIARLNGDLQQRKTELERLQAGARPQEIERQRNLIEAKKVQLGNTRRNQERRVELQEQLARQKVELSLAQTNLSTQQELFAKGGLVAEIKVKEAKSALDAKQHDISATEASIRSLDEVANRDADLLKREITVLETELDLMMEGTRPETIGETKAQVDKLENLLASMKNEIAKSEILAPMDGTVATPFPERKVNQRLEVGSELLRLVDVAAVTVEMLVAEKQLADVKPGQPVWMYLRALSSENFEGRVDFIAPVAQTVNGQQMIVVRAKLANEDDRLKPEMTGSARIYAGKRRIIDLATRRIRGWVRTDVLPYLP